MRKTKYRTYQTLLTEIVELGYTPYWSEFISNISVDDFEELAFKYWEKLDSEAKKNWLEDQDFMECLDDLFKVLSSKDMDDISAYTDDFSSKLSDFFVDEITTDLRREYYNFDNTYMDDDRAYEEAKYKDDVVNG